MSTHADEERGHRVVVGADGSERGHAAVRYAVQEAHRRGAPLEVVHVVPGYVPVGPLPMFPEGSLQAFGASVIERAAEIAHATRPDVELTTHLVTGARIHQLAGFANGADLLVLGAGHGTLLEQLWTGDTVAGVASRATSPVVVVPPSWTGLEPRRRVVAGYKSPQHSAELFDAAFGHAQQQAAELMVLHAWRLAGVYDPLIGGRAEADRWNEEQRTRIAMDLADWRTAYPDLSVHVEVVHDYPARALVDASRTADLLVISRPKHGGTCHHLGDTGRRLLRLSECPVEVVAPMTGPGEAWTKRSLRGRPSGDLVLETDASNAHTRADLRPHGGRAGCATRRRAPSTKTRRVALAYARKIDVTRSRASGALEPAPDSRMSPRTVCVSGGSRRA